MPEAPLPENRAAPLAALLLPETPREAHYRRNHFPYPAGPVRGWRLEVGGAVARPLSLSLPELQEFEARTLLVLLECAGHRRTEFEPPVAGVPWRTGALSQARWTGAPLGEVLRAAGIRPDACEVVLTGADAGPFAGMEGTHPFARSLPLAKAMHPDTLLAWAMGGEELPREHGAPLRAVVPGWYAMDSVKWLRRIDVVAEPFRGPFQELDYRFQGPEEDGIGTRLDEVPVHSLILEPQEGAGIEAGQLRARGIAWGGEGGVATVEVRVDDGPWTLARLEPAPSPYGASRWEADLTLSAGSCVLAARATDAAGRRQPDRPHWNRRGYANHSIHRIPLRG